MQPQPPEDVKSTFSPGGVKVDLASNRSQMGRDGNVGGFHSQSKMGLTLLISFTSVDRLVYRHFSVYE